jgi:excisionase family DNA binding protein
MGTRETLLTSSEVAAILRISVRTVCLWAECSELPAVKAGRRWLFRWSEIESWTEQPRNGRGRQDPGSGATRR